MKNFKKLIKEAYLGNPLNEIVSRLPVEELTDEALTRLRDQFLTTGTRPNAAEMDLLKSVLDEMGKRGLEESINEVESGDIVSYEGEDHTVMRIADDFLGKRIYIRPNEPAVFGGKKDTFWVKPKDLNEVVRGDDFRFIEIKDLHFETDPDRLEDMKIEFGEKMGGFTTKDKIEDAEYELRRFRKEIGYGDGTSADPFLPGTYDAATSKLGDGPHAKKVSTPKWNERKYEQWIEDVASGGGAEFAYDMAQNAKMEAGLIDWVKKNRLGFGDVTPLERIQYDIEALAESINEDLIKETTVDGGNYRSSYQHNQPEEQLTTTEDYEIFMEMFPKGEASRILMDPKRKELYDKHLEWTKESVNNNTFEHMQYHKVEHEGELYKVHQSQYYNGNYINSKDFRNPRFTELMISKDGKSMGTYLVDTYEYIKDLNNLKVKDKVSESLNEEEMLFLDKLRKGHAEESVNLEDFMKTMKTMYSKAAGSDDELEAAYEKFRVTRPNLEEDEDLDINYSDASAGDKSIEDESASGAYESKGFDFKKMVKEALTPKNLR